MADTLQIVEWSLVQACALRSGEAVDEPGKALEATSHAQTYSKYLLGSEHGWGLFGDVCVTSYTSPHPPQKGRLVSLTYPAGGFVVSSTFSGVGGVTGLTAMCSACPANTRENRPAGCAGVLWQYPHSPETQEQLEGILSRLGLEAAYAETFPPTTPIWYGLWARSPLSAPALRLLRSIIGAMHDEDAEELKSESGGSRSNYLPELRAFVRATELAEERGLRLSVTLTPPGHTDFGIYTVFPHCPFCKAAARLERWKRQYPTQLYTCEVCGTQFPPAETAATERYKHSADLREVMGEHFPDFAKAYLMRQGVDESKAAELVASSEAWEEERLQKIARDRRQAERRNRFVIAELFAGLHPQYEEDDDDDDDNEENTEEPGDATPSASSALFDSAEFTELLNRCEARGIRIGMMFHRSNVEERDRWEYRRTSRPKELLAKWQAEGCNERFGAAFVVPDDLLERFPE